MEEAQRMVWPIKMGLEMSGLQPDKTMTNPYVQYTDMEKWFLTQGDFGLGLRKVRRRHEVMQTYHAYQDHYSKLKRRYAGTKDQRTRDLIRENIYELAKTMKGIMAEEKKTLWK